MLVELGTHSGNSYFSFCQTIAQAGLPTKCFAVDTWQGDEHAGGYSDEVFLTVSAHNQKNYSTFSSLLRMTFDAALAKIADATVDLLHIDGLHTYDAVRHDFESWLPKLAPGAVVLFHDTNVRERDFGVYRLWEELVAQYPRHLEFKHSHGLGVLQLDGAAPAGDLFGLGSVLLDKALVATYFASLGARQLERIALDRCHGIVKKVSETITERDLEIIAFHELLGERNKTIANFHAELAQRDSHIAEFHSTLAARDQEIFALHQALAKAALGADGGSCL